MRDLMTRAYVKVNDFKYGTKAALQREEGQDVVEYALILGAVSIVLVGLLIGIGTGAVGDAIAAVEGFDLGGDTGGGGGGGETE